MTLQQEYEVRASLGAVVEGRAGGGGDDPGGRGQERARGGRARHSCPERGSWLSAEALAQQRRKGRRGPEDEGANHARTRGGGAWEGERQGRAEAFW